MSPVPLTRSPFRLVSFLALTALLAVGSAFAGSVTLEWDPSPDTTGYRVYQGNAPGSYDQDRDVGNVTETVVDGLGDCRMWYFAVTAYNDAGESDPSNEASSWPRPNVESALPAQAEQGSSLDVTLGGLNFEPGASVEFSNGGIAVDSVSVNACGEIVVGITIDAGAAVGPVDVSVVNTSGITGTGNGVFAVSADATAPVISVVDHRDVSATRATITWSTNEPADSQVSYRKAGDVEYRQSALDSAMVREHSVTLTGLEPDTLYEYHVRSADAGGNASRSEPDRTFRTTVSLYTYIVFEAEAGERTDPMRAGSGGDAFAGEWLETPPGLPRGSGSNPQGTSTFGVNIPEGGVWYLWVRMYGPDAAANSMFESVDGIARQIIAPVGLGTWEWVAGRTYSLNQGLHDFELSGREAATRADRVLLTDDPDFVPDGQPGADVSPPATVLELQATPASGSNSLSWRNPSDGDLTRVVVRYRTDGRYPVSPWDGFEVTDREAVPGSLDGETHSGLTDGVTYYYSVFAIDGSDNVAEPGRVASTPGGGEVPAPPGNLRVVRR